jgi:hypothetical protein
MGVTWQLRHGVTFDNTGYATTIHLYRTIVKHNNLLIASVDFESTYLSSDGGYTWAPFNTGIISDWTFVDLAIHGSYLWGIRDFFGNAYRRPLTDIVTDVAQTGGHVTAYGLCQNYPNPFNPTTTIRFTIAGVVALSGASSSGVEGPGEPRPGTANSGTEGTEALGAGKAGSGVSGLGSRVVKLSVYDILGREVAVLVDGLMEAGYHEVTFDAKGLSSGTYFYRITTGDPSVRSGQGFVETKKMQLVR